MRAILVLLGGHAVLLALASTNFSIINWLWGDSVPGWNYFQISQVKVWGKEYLSPYPLSQVVCYLLAYATGSAVFAIICLRYRFWLSVLALTLCLIGVLSFGIELHNCFVSGQRYYSWIASFPGLMLILWICIGIQLRRIANREADNGGAFCHGPEGDIPWNR